MSLILVVEDEPHLRENLVDLLELEGFDVISARNGREALSMALRHRPDLVISDVMMPEMSGHDLLKTLRREESLATTPFIFLTARTGSDEIRGGMNMGADDYLTKPFREDELLRAIAARLEKRALEIQKRAEELDELRVRLQKVLPHELRTPLVAILGYAQLLRDGWRDLSDDEMDEMLSDIYQSGKRLKTCSENYALYAHLQMVNGDPITRRAFCGDDATPVESIIAQLGMAHSLTAGRNADLLLNVEEAELAISEHYLFKMVDEVLSNAFKFSEPGSPVVVMGAPDGAMYHLVIRDSGTGMTREQLQHIGAFMQFERDQHEQQGLGLGLTIAQLLATIYGGKVTYESEPGTGTAVHIHLPLRHAHAGPACAPAAAAPPV